MLLPEARSTPEAQALKRRYELAVRGGPPVRLSQVGFTSEPGPGVLLVTARVRLHAGDPPIGSQGQSIAIRAAFVSRESRAALLSLTALAE
jgi:hypothetical protein